MFNILAKTLPQPFGQAQRLKANGLVTLVME
jgi:hypothetical protein